MSKTQTDHHYDAIVIGSGISGGWAAKELTEKGLKTLVLERGRMIKHGDYPYANTDPWDMANGGALSESESEEYHVQNRSGGRDQISKNYFVNDKEHPYQEVKRFDWIRSYHVGGRSLTWGRHSYRLSAMDFEANAKDGIGVDWPVRYEDIAPWYSYVEKFVGISGEKLGLAQLPDGEFLPPMEMNCVEQHVRGSLENEFGWAMCHGRVTNLSVKHKGRGPCQYRNRCNRGCPYGAYFSSNSSTLPAAEATGNLTIAPNSIVHSIIYNDELQKATGVRVIDQETKETTEYFAKIIFCNASTLGSTSIMLNSKSERFPDGLGNDSGQLGKNLMDHHFRVGAQAKFKQFNDKYYKGRRPGGIYIPRFRNLDESSKRSDYIRGFGYQGGAGRDGFGRGGREHGFGADFKNQLMSPGDWNMTLVGFGECLPDEDNKVWLDETRTDEFGIPQLVIDCEFKENEMAMRNDMRETAAKILDKSGGSEVVEFDDIGAPGLGIHEMGTARMGHDPKTSVLNKFNQVHTAPNVFVTDGAFMTSSACQNPSLTYMAFTARAVAYAVEQLKKGNLS